MIPNPDLEWGPSILEGSNSSSPNSSTTFDSNALLSSSLALLGATSVKCFSNSISQPTLYPVIKTIDYLKALEFIVADGDALDMRKWTFQPGQQSWLTPGPCKIGIGVHPEMKAASADFQIIAAAHLATRIVRSCPRLGGTLGGYVFFGFQKEFTVIVDGRSDGEAAIA